jgi:glucoamylase
LQFPVWEVEPHLTLPYSDSSLVLKVIIDRYVSGRDTDSAPLISAWVTAMAKIQQVENRSGGVSTGGLGEPKFNIDETAFTGDWGRPQRDGPALRSTSMIRLANHLLAQGNDTWVKQNLWPVLKLDVGYVADSWNLTGFDLWEEVSGSSFFTTAVQHRSLREGIALATALGDPDKTVAEWTTQADNALCFLQSYWSSEGGYIVANVNGGTAVRSGLDSNTILGSIHTFDPGSSAQFFQSTSY